MGVEYPKIIQGGMGVAISNWHLAKTVSKLGQLGIVSGVALEVLLIRRLQDGDVGGHIRRALENFPFRDMAGRAVVPLDHEHSFYPYSTAADRVRREADVVLVVGSRLGNLDIPYDKYWGDPAQQKIVQIDIDPTNLGVTRPLALGVVGGAWATGGEPCCQKKSDRGADAECHECSPTGPCVEGLET